MMQSMPPTTKQSEGIGFIVEKLLNDFKNDNDKNDNDKNDNDKNDNDNNEEFNKHEKRYDEIKKSILAIYKKIKQRKNYNHNNNYNKKMTRMTLQLRI